MKRAQSMRPFFCLKFMGYQLKAGQLQLRRKAQGERLRSKRLAI